MQTVWRHQVDIVGAHKVLGKPDDRGVHALFAVMVGSMFSNVPAQLCDLQLDGIQGLFIYLNFFMQFPLERTVHNFSLTGFQPIDH